MAVHILGKQYDVAQLKNLRFWAERGLIHYEDANDNSYDSMSVKKALEHVKGLNEFKAGIDGTEGKELRAWVYEQREMIQDFIDDFLKVIQKARDQGEPSDPRASRALKDARPVSVRVPNIVDSTVFD